jgi:hypothetical protein
VITVVEPHADDAWLSLGQHLLSWRERGLPVTIVTVYGNRARLTEAATFAAYVGAAHRPIGIPEANLGLSGEWETEVPTGALGELEGTVIGPLGLQHPEHRAIAAVLPSTAQRYVELPYSRKQSTAEEVNRLLAGLTVVSWLPRSAKANAPSSIFKTQAKFWHFNREDMIGAVEVVVAGAARAASASPETRSYGP